MALQTGTRSSILLEGGQVVKLSSLDVGNLLQGDDDARRRLLGNPYFMAPEACQGRYFSGKLHDIWRPGASLTWHSRPWGAGGFPNTNPREVVTFCQRWPPYVHSTPV